MLNENDLIQFAEDLMQNKDTPPATKATVLRTVLELRGLVGAKASRTAGAAEDMAGNERTADDIKRDIARLKEQLDAESS